MKSQGVVFFLLTCVMLAVFITAQPTSIQLDVVEDSLLSYGSFVFSFKFDTDVDANTELALAFDDTTTSSKCNYGSIFNSNSEGRFKFFNTDSEECVTLNYAPVGQMHFSNGDCTWRFTYSVKIPKDTSVICYVANNGVIGQYIKPDQDFISVSAFINDNNITVIGKDKFFQRPIVHGSSADIDVYGTVYNQSITNLQNEDRILGLDAILRYTFMATNATFSPNSKYYIALLPPGGKASSGGTGEITPIVLNAINSPKSSCGQDIRLLWDRDGIYIITGTSPATDYTCTFDVDGTDLLFYTQFGHWNDKLEFRLMAGFQRNTPIAVYNYTLPSPLEAFSIPRHDDRTTRLNINEDNNIVTFYQRFGGVAQTNDTIIELTQIASGFDSYQDLINYYGFDSDSTPLASLYCYIKLNGTTSYFSLNTTTNQVITTLKDVKQGDSLDFQLYLEIKPNATDLPQEIVPFNIEFKMNEKLFNFGIFTDITAKDGTFTILNDTHWSIDMSIDVSPLFDETIAAPSGSLMNFSHVIEVREYDSALFNPKTRPICKIGRAHV